MDYCHGPGYKHIGTPNVLYRHLTIGWLMEFDGDQVYVRSHIRRLSGGAEMPEVKKARDRGKVNQDFLSVAQYVGMLELTPCSLSCHTAPDTRSQQYFAYKRHCITMQYIHHTIMRPPWER